MSRFHNHIIGLFLIGLAVIILNGCNLPQPNKTRNSAATPSQNALPVNGAGTTPGSSSPSVTPTFTPQPLAARVDGYEISLAEYQAELKQFQAANGGAEPTVDDRKRVLDNLIDQALLANASAENGFKVDDATVQAHIDQLGGETKLQSWMQANGYDLASFRQALALSIASAWMRDKIITAVPVNAEQVHARQILLYNADEANQVYAQLQAGNDFGNLANKYDPVTQGDLGWIARGDLFTPKLADAIFALQDKQFTEVIQDAAGYHIVQALERQPNRPLSAQALQLAQQQAVQTWLQEHRSESQIEVLAP